MRAYTPPSHEEVQEAIHRARVERARVLRQGLATIFRGTVRRVGALFAPATRRA